MSDTLLDEAAALLELDRVDLEQAVALLVKFLRDNHPDRFHDDAAKHRASERFKKAGDLLARFRTTLERAEAGISTGTAIELAGQSQLVRVELEVSRLLQETASASAEIQALRNQKDVLSTRADTLAKQLATKRTVSLERTRHKILQPYQPTRRSITAVGVVAALVVVGAILTQVEAVANKVISPLGLAHTTVGLVLFGLFILTLAIAGYRHLKSIMLEGKLASLCTTAALRRFGVRLRSDNNPPKERTEFSENDVVDFVSSELESRTKWQKLSQLIGVSQYSPDTIDLMKDLVLAHMLAQGLIDAGPAHSLERVFRIRERPKYHNWDHDADLLASLGIDDSF